jgi:hypothetical protein
MMVIMIPAMVSASTMVAPAPAISAHGNQYAPAGDEQGGDGQHKE